MNVANIHVPEEAHGDTKVPAMLTKKYLITINYQPHFYKLVALALTSVYIHSNVQQLTPQGKSKFFWIAYMYREAIKESEKHNTSQII